MSNHTTGPWWAEGATVKATSHGRSFKITRADGLRHTPEGNANNARLIAAAPDLLASLEECAGELKVILQEAGGGWGERSYYAGMQERLNAALEAIAKAKGGE